MQPRACWACIPHLAPPCLAASPACLPAGLLGLSADKPLPSYVIGMAGGAGQLEAPTAVQDVGMAASDFGGGGGGDWQALGFFLHQLPSHALLHTHPDQQAAAFMVESPGHHHEQGEEKEERTLQAAAVAPRTARRARKRPAGAGQPAAAAAPAGAAGRSRGPCRQVLREDEEESSEEEEEASGADAQQSWSSEEEQARQRKRRKRTPAAAATPKAAGAGLHRRRAAESTTSPEGEVTGSEAGAKAERSSRFRGVSRHRRSGRYEVRLQRRPLAGQHVTSQVLLAQLGITVCFHQPSPLTFLSLPLQANIWVKELGKQMYLGGWLGWRS
jgi:hypothetical protein